MISTQPMIQTDTTTMLRNGSLFASDPATMRKTKKAVQAMRMMSASRAANFVQGDEHYVRMEAWQPPAVINSATSTNESVPSRPRRRRRRPAEWQDRSVGRSRAPRPSRPA